MRLVPTGTGNTTDSNAGKLIKLQAQFLKYTETRWIQEDSPEMKPQQCPLFDMLLAMTLPLSQDNQACKLLFHAISPLPNQGWISGMISSSILGPSPSSHCLSPQSPTAIPAGPISLPITSKDPGILPPYESSRVTSSTEAVIQWIWSWFSMPCPFSHPPNLISVPIQ